MTLELDKAPRLNPGAGRLDLGLVATPDLFGAGARLDYRPWENVSLFGLGQWGYSRETHETDWLAMLGGRVTW